MALWASHQHCSDNSKQPARADEVAKARQRIAAKAAIRIMVRLRKSAVLISDQSRAKSTQQGRYDADSCESAGDLGGLYIKPCAALLSRRACGRRRQLLCRPHPQSHR